MSGDPEIIVPYHFAFRLEVKAYISVSLCRSFR